MGIRILKGADIAQDEFPLITESLEYFDVAVEVDDFGVTYFDAQVGQDNDYAVLATAEFRELDESSRNHLRQQIQTRALDGSQSVDVLTEFVDSVQLDNVRRVVNEIAELHKTGLTAEQQGAIHQTVQLIGDTLHDGIAGELERLLDNPHVVQALHSENSFLDLPAADDEMQQRLRDRRMPAWFILDVSYSMAYEARIDHANAFVERLAENVAAERVHDDVVCVIYNAETRLVDLHDRRRFHVGEGTDTGQALRLVGDEIRQQQTDVPVFVALVTDGRPNVSCTIDGVDLDPVSYAARMAGALPENVVLSQFAFAPVDPGDPDRPESLLEFEQYLADLRRITDAAPTGQTCVMVRQSEQHLPWLPMGAWQKARQLSLVDSRFATFEP